MKTKLKALVVVAVMFSIAVPTDAFINPNFTPLDLMKQSEIVLLLEFKDANKEGAAVATVKKVLKGKYEKKTITVELLAGAFEAQGRVAMHWIASGQRQAMIFIGKFEAEGAGGGEPEEEAIGYLHIAGKWLKCSRFKLDQWDMEKMDSPMLGTWAGSTDMLLRCVNYILSDPDADVPVRAGREWDKYFKIGKVEGEVRDANPVDVTGSGKQDLFVASKGGDRIFRWAGKTMKDVTAEHGLESRLRGVRLGDFNRDGRIDLASWDGKGLTVHSQKADGTFAARACDTGGALAKGCLSLDTVDCGRKGMPALLAGTTASPVLVIIREDGSASAKALVEGDFPGKDFGKPGRCFVADFDKDDIPDILQLFAGASLFYKGKGAAAWGAPVQSQVAAGRGRYGACLGDFDADGLFEVFIPGEVSKRFWHNLGGGKFVQLLHESGEIEYISKPGGICARTGDVNNDGRQDILVVYGVEMSPQLFFNRGFRSFGHARMLDLNEQSFLPEAGSGQQTGCLGDFNGDGALDMLLVLLNGDCWIFPRRVEEDGALAVTAALSLGSEHAGPVNVSAWNGDRPLGAFAIRAGGPEALWGTDEPGEITLKWRVPGGELQKKVVELEKGPVRVVVDKLGGSRSGPRHGGPESPSAGKAAAGGSPAGGPASSSGSEKKTTQYAQGAKKSSLYAAVAIGVIVVVLAALYFLRRKRG